MGSYGTKHESCNWPLGHFCECIASPVPPYSTHIYYIHLLPDRLTPKVEMMTETVDRDDVKRNVAVLRVAANNLGLRVGVPTCQVHVMALYDLMQVPVPRDSGN